MSRTESTSSPGGQLERGAMGTADIVFFVLAGVAPMGVVVALLSLSIALGNGAGVPGTYAIAGVVLAQFAAGYVRMSRITNVGGFYTYARQGLGRRAGGATAYVALAAYNAATIGIFGALAYFASQTSAGFGVHISWPVWALIAYAIVAVLAYFEVTMSAKVLGFALVAEVLTLLVFDFAVLARNGFHGFSLDVFNGPDPRAALDRRRNQGQAAHPRLTADRRRGLAVRPGLVSAGCCTWSVPVRRARADVTCHRSREESGQNVVVIPPSTAMVWPVMNDAVSPARKTTTPAISSGRPQRPSAVRDRSQSVHR